MPSFRPLRYPDLQLLRDSCPWDCVIVNGIPEVSANASSPATSPACPDANGLGVSPTSSHESSIGSPAEAPWTLPEIHQAEVSDVEAKSMLILGLRGQNHDLER